MSITNKEIFIVNHGHSSSGQASVTLRKTPLVNPLYRSYFERIASYIPIISTFIGIRTLKGVRSLQYSMILMTGNFSPLCRTLPCLEIHDELPKIKKEAWLEIFGVKGLYYLILEIIKIVKLIIRYLCPSCCPPEMKEPIKPLIPEPLDIGQQIDAIFSTPTPPKDFKGELVDQPSQEDERKKTPVYPKPKPSIPKAVVPGKIQTSPTPGKKPSPTSLIYPQPRFHTMLLKNWAPVDTPFPWPPAEENQKTFAWQLSDSKLVFISTTGSIAQPRFITDSTSLMIVNAANRKMYRDGGGTNQVLSAAVSPESWESSKQPENPGRKGMPLDECECRAGVWRNPDGSSHTGRQGLPHYLAQLLGPKAGDHNSDPKAAFDLCKKAYLNCFKLAQTLRVDFLQIPLISSRIFAPSGNTKNARTNWINAVKSALVSAMQEFGSTPENKDKRMLIVLTNVPTPHIESPKLNN
ncbi:hypothetical protein [Candidatus Chlamydia corallus]|uniref:hypothetical protein n=1 Tax=Candidatus Chlamydia corallus TaxID=2038470 RepID=UPI001EFC46D6|nr:hypothetical protein [Candidatus Chlamydia corallus]